MGFSRWEYWSGLPCPPPGDLPNPGIELESPALAGGFFSAEPPGKPHKSISYVLYYATMIVFSILLLLFLYLKFFFNFIEVQVVSKIIRYLKCTMWFDTYVYCEMITPIQLINTSIILCVRTKLFYSRSRFKLCTILLSTIATILYIRPSDLFHLLFLKLIILEYSCFIGLPRWLSVK